MDGASWSEGDFNGDGCVDDADATLLAANWQTVQPAQEASVPEPGSVILLIGGLTALVVLLQLTNHKAVPATPEFQPESLAAN